MGLLLMQFRKLSLIQRQNNIQFQLTTLNQKLMDLQSMSATLANDSPTLADIASFPPSLFGAGVNQMMMAHNAAMQYATNVVGTMAGNSIFTQFGDNAAYMQKIAMAKAYEQAREQYNKRIQAKYNQEEKQIQLKKTNLETQLACVEEELKGISQSLPQQVSSSISHYGLQG